MFRMMALVRVDDDADVGALVEACRTMVASDENIVRGEVGAGLLLMDGPQAPHASYSLLLDFEDEEAWRRYVAGAPHAAFHELSFPHVTTMMATQYVTEE